MRSLQSLWERVSGAVDMSTKQPRGGLWAAGPQAGEDGVYSYSRQRLTFTCRHHYRVEFTAEDDDHICEFLAMAVPDPAAGGRSGNKLWIQLCTDASYVRSPRPGALVRLYLICWFVLES